MIKILFTTMVIASLSLVSCGGGGGGKSKASAASEEGKNAGMGRITSDLEKELIAGKVTSVRQRVYWCLEKFGRLEKGRLQNMPANDFLKEYNSDGFLTEELHYDVNNAVVSMRKFYYDDEKRLESEESYKAEALVERTVYSYDPKGRIIKKETLDKDNKQLSRIEYNYNDENGECDEDSYNNAGKLASKHVNKYSDGLLVERAKYWGGGTLVNREVYNYDEDKLVETILLKGKEDNFERRTLYSKYVGKNYTVKSVYNSDEEGVEKTFYEYDKRGNLLAYIYCVRANKALDSGETESGDTTSAKVEESSEDEEDDSSEVSETNPVISFKGTGNIYSYTFDEQNNWIQKVTYKVDTQYEGESFDNLSVSTGQSGSDVRQFYYERIYTYAAD
jgi:hypothetical protein